MIPRTVSLSAVAAIGLLAAGCQTARPWSWKKKDCVAAPPACVAPQQAAQAETPADGGAMPACLPNPAQRPAPMNENAVVQRRPVFRPVAQPTLADETGAAADAAYFDESQNPGAHWADGVEPQWENQAAPQRRPQATPTAARRQPPPAPTPPQPVSKYALDPGAWTPVVNSACEASGSANSGAIRLNSAEVETRAAGSASSGIDIHTTPSANGTRIVVEVPHSAAPNGKEMEIRLHVHGEQGQR